MPTRSCRCRLKLWICKCWAGSVSVKKVLEIAMTSKYSWWHLASRSEKCDLVLRRCMLMCPMDKQVLWSMCVAKEWVVDAWLFAWAWGNARGAVSIWDDWWVWKCEGEEVIFIEAVRPNCQPWLPKLNRKDGWLGLLVKTACIWIWDNCDVPWYNERSISSAGVSAGFPKNLARSTGGWICAGWMKVRPNGWLDCCLNRMMDKWAHG